MPRETVSFEDVECLQETKKAILCSIDGEEHWVPQSVVDDDSMVWQEGQKGKLVVHLWWAKRAGLA